MPISFSVINHPAEAVIPEPTPGAGLWFSESVVEKIRGAGLTGEEVFWNGIASEPRGNADKKLLQFSLGNAGEHERQVAELVRTYCENTQGRPAAILTPG